MKKSLFIAKTFPVAGSNKLACLFGGYRDKIWYFRKAIKALNDRGFTVIAYEHSPSVLTSGEPERLSELIDAIYKDLSSRIDDYEEVICVGVSVGAGIGIAMQRRIPKIRRGIYAGAGASPSENIFEAPIFYFVRKAYRKNGHDSASLYDYWKKDEIVASSPLPKGNSVVMALGRRDKIVPYAKASATLRAWQKADIPIKIITKPYLGHLGIILWFKGNLGLMLKESEKISA